MALYRVTVLQMVKPILCQRRHLLARHKVDSIIYLSSHAWGHHCPSQVPHKHTNSDIANTESESQPQVKPKCQKSTKASKPESMPLKSICMLCILTDCYHYVWWHHTHSSCYTMPSKSTQLWSGIWLQHCHWHSSSHSICARFDVKQGRLLRYVKASIVSRCRQDADSAIRQLITAGFSLRATTMMPLVRSPRILIRSPLAANHHHCQRVMMKIWITLSTVSHWQTYSQRR